MFKNLHKIFPAFLQNFFPISLKHERNIFNILRNFRKINNRCFSIIFPELIQNLLCNFSSIFLTFSGDSKHYRKIISKYLKNVLKISNISPKFSASIPKFVFQNYLMFTFSQNYSKDEMVKGNSDIITI